MGSSFKNFLVVRESSFGNIKKSKFKIRLKIRMHAFGLTLNFWFGDSWCKSGLFLILGFLGLYLCLAWNLLIQHDWSHFTLTSLTAGHTDAHLGKNYLYYGLIIGCSSFPPFFYNDPLVPKLYLNLGSLFWIQSSI